MRPLFNLITLLIVYFTTAWLLDFCWLSRLETGGLIKDVFAKFLALPIVLNLIIILLIIKLSKHISQHIFSLKRLQGSAKWREHVTSFLIASSITLVYWVLAVPAFIFFTSVMLWVPWMYIAGPIWNQIEHYNHFIFLVVVMLVVTVPPLLLWRCIHFVFHKIMTMKVAPDSN